MIILEKPSPGKFRGRFGSVQLSDGYYEIIQFVFHPVQEKEGDHSRKSNIADQCNPLHGQMISVTFCSTILAEYTDTGLPCIGASALVAMRRPASSRSVSSDRSSAGLLMLSVKRRSASVLNTTTNFLSIRYSSFDFEST